MWQWLKCRIGRHVVRDEMVIIELGAVFHADICRACLRPWVGEFICNAWDETKTQEVGGVTHLRGVNPILASGDYRLIGDEELHGMAQALQARRRKGSPTAW
jgi:hypothetical protein